MSAPHHTDPTVRSAQQRHAAVAIVKQLQQAGFTAYWAGGCVRDRELGSTPLDYDIATAAPPDRVLSLFPGATAVGKSFGVVVVPLNDTACEVATFRQDHAYRDGRHPSHITFVTPEDDATRRDFTLNAMFYDPVTDCLHDYVGGRKDLAAGIIRCVGNPNQRFEEDHLRMLRAVRFAARFEFTIHDDTANAIRTHADAISRISPERIRIELTRTLLEAKHPGQAVLLLESLGVLSVILPEVAAMRYQEQPPEFHPEGDVLTHTAIMLDAMECRDVVLAMSVLLHDVGKPPTARHDGTRLRFNGHPERGAEIARTILTRLRFPTRIIDSISHCIRNHMRFLEVQRMRRSTLRRLVGADTFNIELELHRLDCLASHGKLDNYTFLKSVRDAMANEPVLPQPWINGHAILALGVPTGPAVGKWLQRAYDAQLEGRVDSPEALHKWLAQQITPNAAR